MNKIKIFYELQSGKANRLDIILFDNTENFIEFKNYTQRVFEQ